MLNRIIEIFGKDGTYVALKPEILNQLVKNAYSVIGNYKKIGKIIGCNDLELYRYRKNIIRAISMDKLLCLNKITDTHLCEEDIVYVQRGKSGYALPSKFIFTNKPWGSLAAWDYYILGALATDGSIYKGNVYFKISPKDAEFSAVYIYNLAKFAEKIHQRNVHLYVGVDKSKRLGGPTNSITLGSKTFIIFLQKVLNISVKTDYSIPVWFYTDSKYMYPWLAGITDGDGYIWRQRSEYGLYWFWDVSNGNMKPLENIKFLLDSNLVKVERIPSYQGKGKYSLRIANMNFISELFPNILPYIIIERKRKRIIQALDYLVGKGFDIKIPEKQRTTRNPIMDKVVDFLKERDLLTKLQNWEKLEGYGEEL